MHAMLRKRAASRRSIFVRSGGDPVLCNNQGTTFQIRMKRKGETGVANQFATMFLCWERQVCVSLLETWICRADSELLPRNM